VCCDIASTMAPDHMHKGVRPPGAASDVRFPDYREQPGWRYVYIGAMFIAFGLLGTVLFGSAGSTEWVAFGIGAVLGIRGLFELRRR
jgi:hypothetical protein